MRILNYNGWRLVSFAHGDEAKKLFSLIINNEYKPVGILKQQSRSSVELFKHGQQDLVLKIPKEKNHNSWIRFTTLYRAGEAFRCIKSMDKLDKLGFNSAQPVMAAERRVLGMVVDSWLIYKYVPGETCLDKVEFYPDVVNSLASLHKMHYLHNDPQIRNFILGPENRIFIIDSKLKRNFFSFYSKMKEWAYLAKSAPGIENYFPVKNSIWYKLAKAQDKYYRKFVRNKRKVLSIFKKSNF